MPPHALAPAVIGITVDNQQNTTDSGVYESAIAYSRAVTAAGGLAVLLPHETKHAAGYLRLCQGLILTGGVDPDTTAFGQPMHPQSRPMDPTRQAFELALLNAASPKHAVLGVCLGMQLMALHAGGVLDPFMPQTMGEQAASVHQDNRRHAINPAAPDSVLGRKPGQITSSHRQRITDTGSLRLIAAAPDGTIEAVDDPTRPFYVGVQWHPERSDPDPQDPLNQGLIRRLVAAASGVAGHEAAPSPTPAPPPPPTPRPRD